MVRLGFSIRLAYEVIGQPADFIFNFEAATTAHQTVVQENLRINQAVPATRSTDPVSRNRLLRLRAEPGRLDIHYAATVDINQHVAVPQTLCEMPIAALPYEVLPYLYPSRYCESDKLQGLANQLFGHLPRGYERVEQIRRWVLARTRFAPGSSTCNTSALDTLNLQAGVCRDFSHLMIALCRALNIPARFASGLDYGADPALGPTDFHAYVEVFLDGRWYLFDPSGTAMPMGFLRIGTGRDAADVSFATIFGGIRAEVPVLTIEASTEAGAVMPYHRSEALSTDAPSGISQ